MAMFCTGAVAESGGMPPLNPSLRIDCCESASIASMMPPTRTPSARNAAITAAPTSPPAMAYSTVVSPSSSRTNARK